MHKLSIVIPVYNEENSIIPTIENINNMMSETDIDYELIVVNDGSTDKTGDILREYENKFHLVDYEINKGYGAALKAGILESKNEVIAITDADGTYPIEYIPTMFKEIHKYNMIVGRRPFKQLPTITKPAKLFITKLASYLADYKIPDINSGLRMFWKKDALRFFHIIPSGFSFTTTISLAMLTSELDVHYMPIEYMKREGKSKIKPFYDTLNFIQLIVRTIIYFNPLKVFIPLAIVLALIGIVVLVASYIWLPRVLDASVSILLLSSIQVLAIGMIADLINRKGNVNKYYPE
ncbi:MAG: glycosyltransferase family 2 protein [Bacteroidales bacterium]|nr:glycosyltransferase family 2 protein [Bacteroidales bacterium]